MQCNTMQCKGSSVQGWVSPGSGLWGEGPWALCCVRGAAVGTEERGLPNPKLCSREMLGAF